MIGVNNNKAGGADSAESDAFETKFRTRVRNNTINKFRISRSLNVRAVQSSRPATVRAPPPRVDDSIDDG